VPIFLLSGHVLWLLEGQIPVSTSVRYRSNGWSWSRSARRWLAGLVSLIVGMAGFAVVDFVGAQAVSVTVFDEVPVAADWHGWWGDSVGFATGPMRLNRAVERNAATVGLPPGSYVLEVQGFSPSGGSLSPYVESHTGWQTSVVPVGSVGSQGQLSVKPFPVSSGPVVWPFTIGVGSVSNTQINLRLVATAELFVSRVTIRRETSPAPTTTSTTVPVAGSVMLLSEVPVGDQWHGWWTPAAATFSSTPNEMVVNTTAERVALPLPLNPGAYVLELQGTPSPGVQVTPYFETHQNWNSKAGPVEALDRPQGRLDPKPWAATQSWPITIAAGAVPSTHVELRLVGSGGFTVTRVIIKTSPAAAPATTTPATTLASTTVPASTTSVAAAGSFSEVPADIDWDVWWGDNIEFAPGTSVMSVKATAQRNTFVYTMAPGTYGLTIEGAGTGTVAPYLETHNNWNDKVFPVQALNRQHSRFGVSHWPRWHRRRRRRQQFRCQRCQAATKTGHGQML
jgi:hypothetical protein